MVRSPKEAEEAEEEEGEDVSNGYGVVVPKATTRVRRVRAKVVCFNGRASSNYGVSVSASSTQLMAKVNTTNATSSAAEVWTNLCISTLLDEYEAVFVKLGRGHLRLKDWEAVCGEVNRRTDGSRTPEQCKAKIENLKKHYRRERLKCSASPSRISRWIFYHKLRQVVGDPTPHSCILPPSFHDPTAVVPLDHSLTKWDMDHAVHDFRSKLCETISDSPPPVPQPDLHPPADLPKDHPSPDGFAEAVDPPKSQPDKTTSRKSSAKHREMASLGRDLKEALSSFGSVIEKIERTKMELMSLLQTQRLEQERQHMEMEMERTRLIMKSQLDLAKLICASSKKDCNDVEEAEKGRKKGRWETAPDGAKFPKTCDNDVENMCLDGEEIVEHENRFEGGGKCNNHPPVGSQTPSPGLRRDSIQFQSENLKFRVNGVSNGNQDFRSSELQSEIQHWSRNESADCAENFREGEAEHHIRQDSKHLTHWETGVGIMQIEHLN